MRRVNPAVLAGAGGALLLVVLIWWFTLWSPRARTYSDISSQAQTADAQVSQLQAQVDRLKSANIPQLNSQLSSLQAAIPDQPQLDQIFLAVNGAASQSGVSLQTIAPSPPAAGSGAAAGAGGAAPAQINLSLTCGGGYFQVLDFINRLDALPRLLVVDSVSLSPGSGANGSELSVSLVARMFVSQLTTTASSGSQSASGSGSAASAPTTTTTAPGAAATTTTTGAGH